MNIGVAKKNLICESCHQRTCCYHYRVTLTGYDVWRVSKSLNIPPSQFAVYIAAEPDNSTAFVLDLSGERYELALAKRTEQQCFGACIFLIHLNDGSHRCGLGDLRPSQCHSYPAYVRDGLVRVMNDEEGCWRTWSLSNIDIEQEREWSEQYEQAKSQYAQVVSRWNERVWSNSNRGYNFNDFCDYLENRYGGLYA